MCCDDPATPADFKKRWKRFENDAACGLCSSAPSVGDLASIGMQPSTEDVSANNSVHSGGSRDPAATQQRDRDVVEAAVDAA
jgi:hypothetical protein